MQRNEEDSTNNSYSDPARERFAHGSNGWSQDPRVTAREIAMVMLMNDITDQKGWNLKIFENTWVEQQKQAALQRHLISPKSWEWCLAETRDKTKLFERNKLVKCLDSGSNVCKSDTLITEDLRVELESALRAIINSKEHDENAPSTTPDGQVTRHIDPSLFPLVRGKTFVLDESDSVKLDSFFESFGYGTVYEMGMRPKNDFRLYARPSANDVDVRRSDRFQWLPCDVEFGKEDESSVKITSYINNVHPLHHKPLYQAVERLISASIEPWNQCLLKKENPERSWSNTDRKPPSGRVPLRIRTYGADWAPEPPAWGKDQNLTRLEADKTSPEYQEARRIAREYIGLPKDESFDGEGNPKHWYTSDDDVDIEEWEIWPIEAQVQDAWLKKYQPLHPEPGGAYSYEEWKRGQNGKAIFDRVDHRQRYFDGSKPPQDLDHEFYDISLQETFREKGLQVIVKTTSIDLTPESPEYKGSEWYFEAQLNEHIGATTAYYYDVQNITESKVSFRQRTTMCENEYVWQNPECYGDGLTGLASIFGFEFRDEIYAPKTQEIGYISTQQGRIVSWPNVMQHRIEPFTLVDRTKPGHRRAIVLYLVDPHYRIHSTKKVPPQQHDWWTEVALARKNFDSESRASALPQELLDLVSAGTEDWPMGMKEAKRIKREVEHDRMQAFQAVNFVMPTYMFEDGAWGP